MPNVADIAKIAESLEKSPVYVARDRCVAVRNRNASCHRCTDACTMDAITVSANEITLSAALCSACGACTVVCPTEALVALRPPEAYLTTSAAGAAVACDGVAFIACARRASKHEADPAQFAEVPCLARVSESVLVQLAAHGVADIQLVDGVCETCKYRACSAFVDETVAFANDLIAGQGGSARVSRVSQFPEAMLGIDTRALYGSDRRGFFSEAASAAKESAMAAAQATIRVELGAPKQEPSIGQRLRVGADGALPRLEVARHTALLDALDRIGEAQVDALRTRTFGSVSIDTRACNACGMCAAFCPTGALVRDEAESPGDPVSYLEFQACDCVQCRLCADVCWKKALTVSETVSTDELFDFEPRVFDLVKSSRTKMGLF